VLSSDAGTAPKFFIFPERKFDEKLCRRINSCLCVQGVNRTLEKQGYPSSMLDWVYSRELVFKRDANTD
jgi:hypothetical protein